MTPRRLLLAILVLLGGVVAIVVVIVMSGIPLGFGRLPLPAAGTTPLPMPSMPAIPDGAVRVLAAGDIGRCGSPATVATGALLDAAPDAVVLALGDLAYERATTADFANCYDPFWGPARERTIAVPGNHEYLSRGAAGYFGYLGDAAGTPDTPWRAQTVGAWRVYALDSECSHVGGCGEGSAQLEWLRADLAAHPSRCTLALWHRPRVSSGPHGGDPAVLPFWRTLAAAGADIELSGHEHIYERFAPMDADERIIGDGMRSWVVGTGGDNLYELRDPSPGSEVRANQTFGVLELILRPDGYDWRFLAAMGAPFEDIGSGTC